MACLGALVLFVAGMVVSWTAIPRESWFRASVKLEVHRGAVMGEYLEEVLPTGWMSTGARDVPHSAHQGWRFSTTPMLRSPVGRGVDAVEAGGNLSVVVGAMPPTVPDIDEAPPLLVSEWREGGVVRFRTLRSFSVWMGRLAESHGGASTRGEVDGLGWFLEMIVPEPVVSGQGLCGAVRVVHRGSTVLRWGAEDGSCGWRVRWERMAAVLVMGDSQSGAPAFRSLLEQGMSRGRVGTLLHLGDVAQTPWSMVRELRSYLFAPLMAARAGERSIPLVWSAGNHDRWDADGLLPSSPRVVRLGPMAVLVLDVSRLAELEPCSSAHAAQMVEAELSPLLASQDWVGASVRLVAAHVPVCVEYWEAESWEAWDKKHPECVRTLLHEVLAASPARVHVVLSGHSHVYQRGIWRWSGDQMVHVITLGASGGGLEAPSPVHSCGELFFKTVTGRHLAGMIRSEGGLVKWEVFDQTGRVVDTLLL
jgi:hypothetical protein